jgi:glycosyltransferase involved in cell wall biosynthesis
MMPFDLASRKRYPIGYMRFRNWLLEKKLLKSMMDSDLVIFISDYAKKVILERSDGRIKSSVVIHHGINPIFYKGIEPQSVKPSWLPSSGYLLYVSIFDYYKAQLEVVRGFAIFKSKTNSPLRLVLIGPDKSEYAKLVKSEIEKLGLKDDVIIRSDLKNNDLPTIYQNAFLNIFASHTENCPFILLEALASGRPSLVSNKMPMPEFGGDSVVYFDPESPEDLASKILVTSQDLNLISRMSDSVLLQAKKFDWKKSANQTWHSIRELGLSESH